MLKLSLTNPYDSSFTTRIKSDVDPIGVTKLSLSQLNLNQPYRLDFACTSEFPYYEEIANDPIFNGLKIQTDYVNLGFVMADGKRRLGLQSEYTLFSTSQKLARTISYPDQIYNGSLDSFLSNLSSDFVFTSISTAPNDITIETAWKSDLELLNEAVKYVDFFAWRDNGLIDVGGGVLKGHILYGNFGKDIVNYYNTNPSTRLECKPLYAYNSPAVNSYDVDIIDIEDVDLNLSVNYYNRLYIFCDTGQGMAQNARIPVVPSSVNSSIGVTVNPQYPLLPTTKNGVTAYYLQVPGVSSEPVLETALIYSSSGNSQDQNLNQNVTPRQAAQRAYQDAINYARSQKKASYYSIQEGSLKRITLPGNPVEVSYKEQSLSNLALNINTTLILDPVSDLDLTDIQN